MKAKNHTMTISNYITVSRLAMLPFIIYFLLNSQRVAAFIIMLTSLLSDAVDGYVARRLNQESETGKFLDPFCDKISLIAILITLLLMNSIPLWGVIVIVSRDILILIGSFVLWRNKAIIFKSITLGKITGILFGAIICAFTLNLQQLGVFLLYVCIPIMIVTFAIYLNRYIKTMKGARSG